MRIALLTAIPNPGNRVGNHVFNVSEKRPPNGIGFLYALLVQAGHQVNIFDRYCGDTGWPDNDFADYDVFGVYCATICTNDIAYIIYKSKAKRIIVGGPHAALFPKWFNRFDGKVNTVVCGEAEKVIVPLVEGTILSTEINTQRLTDTDLELLPPFPYNIFRNEKYRYLYNWTFPFDSTNPIFTMNTSRGCPFSCTFCSVKNIWGRSISYMSAERIFSDIKYVQTLGARGIYFREDNFTLNNDRVAKLCELLIEANANIKWACETRVDTIPSSLMILMKQAGCIGFYVGVEHGSQKMLDIFKKGVTIEKIIDFFDCVNALEIKTAVSIITGHPQETATDVALLNALTARIKPNIIWGNEFREDG